MKSERSKIKQIFWPIIRVYRFFVQEYYPTTLIYNWLKGIKHKNYFVFVGNLVGLDEYLEINDIKKKRLLPPEKCLVYEDVFLGDDQATNQSQAFDFPEVYVTELYNAHVFGGFSLITIDKDIILPIYNNNTRSRWLYRNFLLKAHTKTQGVIRAHKSDIKYDEAIFLCGSAGGNYFHFLMEVLPKLALLEKKKLYTGCPIILDSVIETIPSLMSALALVNISKRQVIFASESTSCLVRKLIYVSSVSLLPINLRANVAWTLEDRIFSFSAIKHMKEMIINRVQKQDFEKIYLARYGSDKNLKRFRNDEQIAKKCEKNGFKIVFPEKYSFEEQVSIFMGAHYIIGSAGAANTNLLFCSKNTSVYIIFPKEFKINMWYTIAKNLELNPIMIDANVIERNEYEVSSVYEVSGDDIGRILEEINTKSVGG